MSMAAIDSSARWRTFFSEAKESEMILLLSKQSDTPVLELTFHDLQAFDPEFAEDVLAYPSNILNSGRRTLNEICRERGEDIDCILRVGEHPRDSCGDLRDVGSNDIDRLRSAEVTVSKIIEIKLRINHTAVQPSL